MSKYCRNCGNKMNNTDKACSKCGTKVESTTNNSTEIQNNNGSNGIAIGGFVCALLGINLIGLILSIIGINNAKKCDGKNKGLAIAGVIISALRLILSIVLIFIIIFWSIFPSIKEEINDEWENLSEYQEDYDYDNDFDDDYHDYNINLKTKKDGKVVVYYFRGDGCSHCDEATKWFNSIKKQYGNKFVIEDYEVWYNEDNLEFMNAIAESRKEAEKIEGVPYIIIGQKSWIGFEKDEYGPEIIKQIEELYKQDI